MIVRLRAASSQWYAARVALKPGLRSGIARAADRSYSVSHSDVWIVCVHSRGHGAEPPGRARCSARPQGHKSPTGDRSSCRVLLVSRVWTFEPSDARSRSRGECFLTRYFCALFPARIGGEVGRRAGNLGDWMQGTARAGQSAGLQPVQFPPVHQRTRMQPLLMLAGIQGLLVGTGIPIQSRCSTSLLVGTGIPIQSRCSTIKAAVQSLQNRAEFDKSLKDAGNSLVVIDYATSW
jgi:hypothetical protein